jgi:hypothetical protein
MNVGQKNTVQNEFEFPGDQTVGLPTLVQNPPTTNNNGNPINKSWLSKPVAWPIIKPNKIGLAVGKPTSFWVASYPTQSIRLEKKRKEKKKEKKDRLARGSTSQSRAQLSNLDNRSSH